MLGLAIDYLPKSEELFARKIQGRPVASAQKSRFLNPHPLSVIIGVGMGRKCWNKKQVQRCEDRAELCFIRGSFALLMFAFFF